MAKISSFIVPGLSLIGFTAFITYMNHQDDLDKVCNSKPNTFLKVDDPVAIDQVFRDHDGYRVNYTDDQGKLIEKKLDEHYNTNALPLDIPPEVKQKFPSLQEDITSHGVVLYKDLVPGSTAFYQAIQFQDFYRNLFSSDCTSWTYRHFEIHLPKNAKISAGNEEWGSNKYRHQAPMHEIK